MYAKNSARNLPPYWCADICTYAMTDRCIELCVPQRDGRQFEIKKGLTLQDMPPFPQAACNKSMTPKERQIIIGAYMAKVVEHLQGREQNNIYWNQRTRPRIPSIRNGNSQVLKDLPDSNFDRKETADDS